MRADGLENVVMTSDGIMESIHPTQLRKLLSQGLVFWTAGRWRTELTGVELARVVQARMGVCDFCSRPDVAWEFPCRDFKMRPIPGIGVGQGSHSSWGACERCALLIRTGRWERLGTRAVAAILRDHPEMPESHLPTIHAYTRELHRSFNANRTGPPTRVGNPQDMGRSDGPVEG